MSARHEIRVEGEDRVFECAEDESVLAALSPVHRRRIRCGCRGGGCGVCKIEIVEGEADLGAMSAEHVSEADRARGVVLACRAYPRSALRLRVLPSVVKSPFGVLRQG